MINMGVIQGKASGMTKQELIDYAKTLDLTKEQKARLWSHWQTVQKLKEVCEK